MATDPTDRGGVDLAAAIPVNQWWEMEKALRRPYRYREGVMLMAGELISAKNITTLKPGDTVKRVNLFRRVHSVVGRYSIRLEGEDRFWDVRAPLLAVTFVQSQSGGNHDHP